MSQQFPHQHSYPLSPLTLEDHESGVAVAGGGDDQSIATGMSALSYNSHQTSASKRSVLGDALLILRGINPKDVIPEEGEENQRNDILENKTSFESAVQTEEDIILGKSVVLSKSSRDGMPNGTRSANLNNHTSSSAGGGGGVRFMNVPPPTRSSASGGMMHLSEMSERSDTTTGTAMTYIDFLKDDYRTMTYGRRIALFLMKKYKWYYPRLVKQTNTKPNTDATTLEQELPPEEEEVIEPMHPLLAASIQEQLKRNRRTSKNPLSPKKKKSFVSYRDLVVAASKSAEEDDDFEVEEDDKDPNIADLRLCHSNTSQNSVEEQRLLLDGQYPFTHSRRESPTLEKAWAYFDHVALSRYVLPPPKVVEKKKCLLTRIIRKVCCKANKKLERAEPGERVRPTALYQPLFTPHNQLGDFGLGIGLYFSTLRAITVITLLATIVNIPNFIYYASSEYTPGISNFNSTTTGLLSSVPKQLQGSAICTDVSWVICPECNTTTSVAPHLYFPNNRRAYGYDAATGRNVSDVFYLRNNCATPSIQTSMINYATIILFLVGTIGLNIYLQKMEVAFDEDEQTAQDYSILISNPPGDATNPEEWHTFFKDNFGIHVTACTVAVDNDLLVRSLVERREILRQIEMLVEPGTSLDTLTLAGIAAKVEKERTFFGHVLAIVVRGIPELFARLTVLTAKVQGLAQQDYPATNVFVTFETEAAQRQVLAAYNLGSIDVRRNNIKKLSNPQHLFRGQLILRVKEPDEPNTIRWQDLNVTTKAKLKQQLMTILATFGAIVLIAYLVYILNNNEKSLRYTAFAIAICNSVFPQFAKFLTSCEAHSSEGNKQRSLYFKIALFRWVNTAVVITIITPFTATLTNGKLVNQVFSLFIAEILTSNAILLLDPLDHVKRHIFAPRAMTQDAMNLNMQGAVFELAERYTNMTKTLFLALWYCTVYPGALLMCSFALFINYFVDRFALMRTWKRPPKLGSKISEFSRQYFFLIALLAMAVLANYYWAGFPFDNLCLIEDTNNSTFVGEWTIRPFDSTMNQVDITFLSDTDIYQPCLQDFFRFPLSDKAFPFISPFQLEGEEWMTVDQELITDIFGWTSVGVLVIIFLSFFYRSYTSFMNMFRGSYEACGDDMGINFSEVPTISTYIPEVQSPVISYPLLACHIDRIDKELLEWTDPDRPHTFYDLTKDADVLLRGTDVSTKVVFSQIAHWPPQDQRQRHSSAPKEQQLNRSGSVSIAEWTNEDKM